VSVRPGGYVRWRYGSTVLGVARLDQVTYDYATQQATIQGTDAVSLLARTKVAYPASPLGSFRAYCNQLLALTPFAGVITMQSTFSDPPIGHWVTPPTEPVVVWAEIMAAAVDCLHFVWPAAIDSSTDPITTELRFRSFGAPDDQGLTFGLAGIPTIAAGVAGSVNGVINRVIAKDLGSGEILTLNNLDSQLRHGLAVLDRSDREIPNAAWWAPLVLDAQADALLEYLPAQVVPLTADHLAAIAALGGVELVRIRLDVPDPAVIVDVQAIALELVGTADGWLATMLGFESALRWTTPPYITQ
jgi:hypothetical protein